MVDDGFHDALADLQRGLGAFTPSLTMRHKMALAVCQKGAPFSCCWRDSGENVEASKKCASCQSIVSRVLKAMREPTEVMVLAAFDGTAFQSARESEIKAAWQAMINEALKE